MRSVAYRRGVTSLVAAQTLRRVTLTRACSTANPIVHQKTADTKVSAGEVDDGAEAVLPGVDLARRVCDPSPEFPSTWSCHEPLKPDDPRIMWRELYDLEEERPYYHNVKTNETSHKIPDGFVTRFPLYYKKKGYHVDEATGAVFAEATAKTAVPKKLTMKHRLAAYGGGGLLWYLIVHNISLACVFCSLYFFHFDLVSVARSYGFNVKRSTEVPKDPDLRPGFFKTFVLSVFLNKTLVPAQMLFSLATAPFLVKRLEPLAVVLAPRCKAFVAAIKCRFTSAKTA